MGKLEWMMAVWPHVAVALTIFIATVTSSYVVLYKRDSRSAMLWVMFIWLVPILGSVLYLMFGVNRIRLRARALRGKSAWYQPVPPTISCAPEHNGDLLPESMSSLRDLAQFNGRVLEKPLSPGNNFEVLVNGDEAYPAMLDAIHSATKSISLCTYIFDNDPIGRKIADALEQAQRRGVKIKILIDDAGARYSWPSIVPLLRQKGLQVVRFLPTLAPWRLMTMNLRNHRKLMVVDGKIGFTGGMNIRQGHILSEPSKKYVQDVQFKIEGPVVAQLQEAFAADWTFCTGKSLDGEEWFPHLEPKGNVIARGIVAGPDKDFEKLRWTIQGALACAKSSVKIVTPYFLPDSSIIAALNVAAMRGVEVDIVLPSKNNLPYMQWAMAAMLWQVLERGCRVWETPPPFDHTKLLIVDHAWCMVGSANWDARSLRLNFEFNLECYGPELADNLLREVEKKMQTAREVTLNEMDRRSLPIRLRDGVARLATPYL
ncbi:MAG: cardiolipin synthase [Verrucomicrobiales bacterium]